MVKALKLSLSIFLALVLLVLFKNKAFAIEDPRSVPNNRFGIHILDESDLEDAASLVNSNGGDWGYVTLVIRKDERDSIRWQRVFDKMRRLHLIPIVRIATIQKNDSWEKPSLDEIDSWVSFLNSLNWVVKNRYLIIGNEPNHAPEWGGEVSPEEYANYFYEFTKRLKEKSDDFFIMPAALDASAPNSKDSVSEDEFLKRMFAEKPDVANFIDGLASHSYPNPDFSGSQDAQGRGTIKTFEWELDFLKNLGVKNNLAVFITETGWAHTLEEDMSDFDSEEEVAQKLKTAYQTAWNDPKVVTVTPFILNYSNKPFDNFSWKKKDGSFYSFYYEIKNLSKTKGTPVAIVAIDILSIIFPPIIPVKDAFIGVVYLKNVGQTILQEDMILTNYRGFEIEVEPKILSKPVEPGDKTIAILRIKTD